MKIKNIQTIGKVIKNLLEILKSNSKSKNGKFGNYTLQNLENIVR